MSRPAAVVHRVIKAYDVRGLVGDEIDEPLVTDVGAAFARLLRDEGDGAERVVVGYDSGNGVVAAFDLDTLAPRWRRDQDHASHLLLYADTGELVTGDNTDVVVLDISTGHELARTDSGGGVQSVLFPAPGFGRDFYVCSFLTVTRVTVTA